MGALTTWTEDRLARLRRMAGRVPADEIAMTLGFSESAVRQRATALKLSLRTEMRADVGAPLAGARHIDCPQARGVGRRAVRLARMGRRDEALALLRRAVAILSAEAVAPVRTCLEHLADLIAAHEAPAPEGLR